MRRTAVSARARGALVAAFALALAFASAPAAAQISLLGLKNSLVQFVLGQISVEGEFEITAEGVEEPRDGVTELVGVAIADGDGVWFRADGVALRWNASRVLRGELEINELVVRGMRVLRPPTPPEVEVREGSELDQAGFDPFVWPRVPITTRVERLAFEDAFVNGGVIAGPSFAFDAEGSFRDEGNVQALALDLRRTDEVEGRIALDYLRDFAQESLRLKVQADEAPGGMAAALAGLPADSASSLRVDAEGPLADWSLDFAAEAERVVTVSGAARVDARAPVSATAQAVIRPGEELGEAARTALGEEARLDVALSETENGRVVIERGDFDSPSLTASASGEYVRGPGRMDFDLTLEARSALSDLAAGVAFERVGFDGRLEGTPEDFEARGAASLTGLETAPADIGQAELEVVVARAGPDLSLAADGHGAGLRIDRLGPDLLGDTDLALRAAYGLESERVTLDALSLVSPLLEVEASGEADLAAERVALDYAVSTPDLAPVAAAYDADAAGRLSAEGRAEGPLSAPRLTGEARAEDLALQGQDWGRVVLTHDVTAGEVVSGSAALEAEGGPYGPASASAEFSLEDSRLDLSALRAEALEASVEGALAVDLETMLAEGAVRLDAPRLAAASDLAGMDLAGAARGEVRLDAPEDAQRVALDLTGEGIRADGAAVETAALEAVLRDALGAPSATYSLRASGLAAEGARVAELELDGEAADLTGAPSATAQGVLRGIEAPDGAATVETLRLDLSAEDLIEAPRATLEAEAETLRAGDAAVARLTVAAQGEDLTGAPRGSLQAEASGLRLAEGVTLRTLTLEAQGENLAEDPTGRAELVARGLEAEDAARLARVTLTAEGGVRDLALRLRGEGETDGGEPVSLAADAAGAVAGEAPVLRVSRLEAAAGEAALRLRAPLALRRDGESWRAEGLDLALPGGSLRGAAALHPDGASGDLRLAIDDLAALAELAEAPVDSGRLDLSADFDTRPASPRAAIDLTGRDLVFSDIVAQDGALALDASGRWDGRAARLTGTLSGPFDTPFDLRATLPLVPSGGPLPRLPEGGALDAGVEWQGPVETIWPLLPLPDHDLRGDLDLDLRVTGALTDPRVAGEVSLREGAYQNLDTGTILADMSVTSEIAGGRDLVLRMEATDGAGAPVRADIRLEGRTLEATLTSEEAVLVRREDVTAATTLDLRAEGPLAAPLVSGEIRVDRAEVRLVNDTPPSLPMLDVVVKGAPPPPEPEAGEGGPQLDIRVHAPGDIFVRGRGLVSEWEMDLRVTGSAAAPRITGAIERRRGQLDFLGRAFALSQGQVRFQGASPIDPYIDVSLEHERQEITGRIVVRGPASDPEVAFESEPALPEGEVLPRVIFGRSRQSLSSGEALQLGIGVATLLSGREGPLGGVRSAAGLDVLSVDTSGESATVRAGRNVAEGVFVGVEQPVEGGSSAVEVEVEVLDNVTVDARTGGDEGSSVGVNWKYDF